MRALEDDHMRQGGGRIPGATWLMVIYVLFTLSGLLALTSPSPVLLRQGGQAIAIAWAVCCLLGAAIGLWGTLSRRTVIELAGQSIGATASLTWVVALIMQAIDTHSRSPLTSACLAGTTVALILQRWIDAARAQRGGGRE
jgi:hypothetical protein